MKKWITRLIFLVALSVFIYSAFNLGKAYYQYHLIDQDNQELVDKAIIKEETSDELPARKIDFKVLKEINKDIIGWIYVPGTNIDYAVLKGQTNNTYLRTNYKGEYSSGGSIFIDVMCHNQFTDDNTIVYGHNMKNGSMFANIKKYDSQEFLDKYHQIYIYLPNNSVNIYEIFTYNILDATNQYYYSQTIDYTKYVNNLLKNSRTSREINTDISHKLVMLSTCEQHGSNNRRVIYGKLTKNVNI